MLSTISCMGTGNMHSGGRNLERQGERQQQPGGKDGPGWFELKLSSWDCSVALQNSVYLGRLWQALTVGLQLGESEAGLQPATGWPAGCSLPQDGRRAAAWARACKLD